MPWSYSNCLVWFVHIRRHVTFRTAKIPNFPTLPRINSLFLMANCRLLTLDPRNLGLACLTGACFMLLLSSCGTTPNLSALENDELYLSRGEEFITDAQYLAFALQEAGYADETESDYYDPSRAQSNDLSSGYRPSFMNNQNAMQWGMGLTSGFNPYGFGQSFGNDPYMNSGFGYNPYGGGMGYGNSGFGYNPYGGSYGGYGGYNGYNPFGGYGGYNGYNGYNPYGGGYNAYNYGNWTGSDSHEGGSTVTGYTRTPIMSNASNGSNYDAGSLVRPKDQIQSSETYESPSSGSSTSGATPDANNSREMNRWLQSPSTPLNAPKDVNPSGLTTPDKSSSRQRTRATRTSSWGSSQPAANPAPRNNSNSSTRPSNNSSSGSSRPAGTSRSSRGGGH